MVFVDPLIYGLFFILDKLRMGQRAIVWSEWARANGKLCKVIFLILLASSLCLLIGGGVKIATNQDNNLYDPDHDDDWVEEFEKNMCVPYYFES